jgi:phenylalanyl-tRNA synthetase beta chain
MNILIPDSWLRVHLKTKATPKQIKDCLSLSGPSIERINMVGSEPVYDIEVTTNRVDMFCVRGVAREASVILPEYGITAELLPIELFDFQKDIPTKTPNLSIQIKNNPDLCQRILAIKLENITLGSSPEWLKKRLELVGQRPLNNIVDITNYVMWEIGHPLHAFDYDSLMKGKLIVREAKKGETLITLDKLKHTLNGGEIVFDDGRGNIIDVPGIMGTENTIVTDKTKNVLLFTEDSDPVKIRYASMGLAIRTQAAIINEKWPDPKLSEITLARAVTLARETCGAKVGSNLLDIYPEPEKAKTIILRHHKLEKYIGDSVKPERAENILKRLGCTIKISTSDKDTRYSVIPPSFRIHDISIEEDLIEEIARIYGYHKINPVVPTGSDLNPLLIDPELAYEREIKIRMRDFGFTEIYPYSMISESDMQVFGLDKSNTYSLANPLSDDFIYMRPSLIPTLLKTMEFNQHYQDNLHLFELSHAYLWRGGNLPDEHSFLAAAWCGEEFALAKGLAESLFQIMGVAVPELYQAAINLFTDEKKSLQLGDFGWIGIVKPELIGNLKIKKPVTLLELDFVKMVASANPVHNYKPVSKFPSAIEDLSFVVPPDFKIGEFMYSLKKISKIIISIELIDSYSNSRTVRITMSDMYKNLTSGDIQTIREKIIEFAARKYSLTLKTVCD